MQEVLRARRALPALTQLLRSTAGLPAALGLLCGIYDASIESGAYPVHEQRADAKGLQQASG